MNGDPSQAAGHRQLLVLQGPAEEVRARALALLGPLARPRASGVELAWIGPPLAGRAELETIPSAAVSRLLGQTLDLLVFDASAGLDADALGAAHGLVRGGGVLVLLLGPPGQGSPAQFRGRFAAYPYRAEDVVERFAARFERALDAAIARGDALLVEPAASSPSPEATPSLVLGPPPPPPGPESEQSALVDRLVARWSSSSPSATVIVADRGRGKSSALGLALARILASTPSPALDPSTIAVSAAGLEATAELLRFAGPRPPRFVPLAELCASPGRFSLVIIDEAAQLPNAMLRRVVERHGAGHLAFATTTHGYEGTGRGFELRFAAWLERWAPDYTRLSLREPIRWRPGDPVERFVFEALALDAQPLPLQPQDTPEALVAGATHERLDRDALAADEGLLRQVFGLLVQAHYRTTPRDLQHMLDAPNLAVHVLRCGARVLAASIVAREGELSPDLCSAVARGQARLRAHALADNLVAHLGEVEAGRLTMIRSVRIVVDPRLRRRGLASRLVEAIHRHYRADLFGTLFGATAELLHFRQGLGYTLVRVSASRGARSGEPAALMLRPVSAAGQALVERLRRELARALPSQLALLEADETLLAPELRAALACGLPPAEPLSEAETRAQLESYLTGPRTADSVIVALQTFVEAHPSALASLDPRERVLVEARILATRSWSEAARAAGFGSISAAMKALRPAVRELVEAVESDP